MPTALLKASTPAVSKQSAQFYTEEDALALLKVAFFQKLGYAFHISKTNMPNHYPELEI
jgi:hypothetical protein